MINIRKIQGENWICNCYIIHDEQNAVVVDPGSEYSLIKACLGELKVTAVLATHGHYDHIVNVSNLAKDYHAPFYIHSGDSKLIKHANFYLKMFHGEQIIEIPKIDHLINDNEELDFKFVKLKVLHTPGHTEGSVCYLFEDNLFTGDFLMKNKIGRVDLPGGDLGKLKLSLKRIDTTFADVAILPGHRDNSTLKEERMHNRAFIDAINL